MGIDSSFSKRISTTVNRLVNSNVYGKDWELINLPKYQSVVILIPTTSSLPAIQLIMNTLTGAWTRFDLPTHCGAEAGGKLFFGTNDGRVCIFGGGNNLDGVKLDGTGGVPVQCSLFAAYNYMEDHTTLKHFKLVRPIFQTDQPPSYRLTLNMDFDTATLAGSPAPPGPDTTNPLWDAAIWDQSFWSAALTTFRPWVGVSGVGFCCALLLKVASTDSISFVAVEYVFEKGGVV